MLAKTFAAAVHGVDARIIEVEVNAGGELSPGTNMYNLVGLPTMLFVKDGSASNLLSRILAIDYLV